MEPQNSQTASRRSFLQLVGGIVLGPVAVFDKQANEIGESDRKEFISISSFGPYSHPMEVVARLAARPLWCTSPRGEFLIWTEYFPGRDRNGEIRAQMMQWYPDTDEALAQARRFYQAGLWRSYSSFEDLERSPRLPGPFVVRFGLARIFWYLKTVEENALRWWENSERCDNKFQLWTRDLDLAVQLSHERAIRATIRIQTILGEPDASSIMHLEPVGFDEANMIHETLSFEKWPVLQRQVD